MTEDRGPSYWDVSEYAAHLREKYSVQICWRVNPPVRVDSTGKWTSWSCVCEVWDAKGQTRSGPQVVAYWGAGGSWKTAPAALYHSLSKLGEWLEDREEVTRAAARF